MKRPAEAPLLAEDRCGAGPPAPAPSAGGGNPFAGFSLSASDKGNPFAGVSLFSSPTGGGLSLFAATAADAAASAGGSGDFDAAAPKVGAAAGGPSAAAPAADGKAQPANPFMGMSLFSDSAPSSGGLFTAAAGALCGGGAAGPSVPAAGLPEPAAAAASAAAAPAAEDAARAAASAAEAPEAAAPEGAEEADSAEAEDAQAADGPDVTGEEDEQVVFRAEGKLWKLVRSAQPPSAGAPAAAAEAEGGQGKNWRWQERGCGVVHINRHGKTGAGRLVMRMRGVLKLLLNTPVFPTTKYEKVGQKSMRFVGVDTEEDGAGEPREVALCAYRLSLQSGDQQAKFLAVLRDLGVSAPA